MRKQCRERPRSRAAATLAFAMLAAWSLDAPAARGEEGKSRPKVALVLAGGGARGTAHAGVLRVLEDMRIPVDLVVGTSMGAVVGCLYAAGMDPEEIQRRMEAADWQDLFSDRPRRDALTFRRKEDDARYPASRDLGFRKGRLFLPRGYIAGQKLSFLLKTMTLGAAGIEDFDRLPVPFRAVATDLATGEMVVLARGDLSEAVQASMSVPGIFAPVVLEGRTLVDGGVVRNLPIDVARNLGADVVIIVNIPSLQPRQEDYQSLVGVSRRVIDILTDQNVRAQMEKLGPDDILIAPELGEAPSTDFTRVRGHVAAGEAAAREKAEELARLSLSPERYAEVRKARGRKPMEARRLDFVRVEGPARVAPEVLRGNLKTRAGDLLDLPILEADLSRLYAMGDFERVDFSPVEEGGRYGLILRAREKSWGPSYLRFALKAADDLEGESSYSVLVSYLVTWLNPLGGEWKNEFELGRIRRLFTEFYQPLESSQTFFLAPRFEYRSEPVDLFAGDDRIAQFGISRVEGGADVGARLGRSGELRLGVRKSHARSQLRIGSPALTGYTASRAAYALHLATDGIDNPNFPRRGMAADLSLYLARKELGSDASYDKVAFHWKNAVSYRKWTMQWDLDYGGGRDTAVPLDDQFPLGGFLSLSGLRSNQLRGPYKGLTRLIFRRQTGRLPSALGEGLYFGLSAEGGNVWQRRADMRLSDLRLAGSLFFGADLAIGPLYLAYGHAESGQAALYFSLGHTF